MSKNFKQTMDDLFPQNSNIEEIIDIPTIVLIGASFGPLFTGIGWSTLMFTFESSWEGVWQWQILQEGLIQIGVGLIFSIVSIIYWWLIPRRLGPINPRLFGFTPLLAFIALIDGGIVGGCAAMTLINYI